MKSYKLLGLLFFIVFFSSCGNETEKKTNDQPKKAHKKSSRQEKVNKQEKYEIKFTDFSNQENEFVEIFLSINDKKYRVDELHGMGINTIEKAISKILIYRKRQLVRLKVIGRVSRPSSILKT